MSDLSTLLFFWIANIWNQTYKLPLILYCLWMQIEAQWACNVRGQLKRMKTLNVWKTVDK